MLDSTKCLEVKNELNILEQLAPALHGTTYFSPFAVHIVHLLTLRIRKFCAVFMHKKPGWQFIHETGWQSVGGCG
jgi:hypothetical protein